MAVFLLHGNATGAEQQPIRDVLKKSIPELIDVVSLTAMLESAAKIKKDERSVGIALLPLGNDHTFDQLVQFVDQHRDEIFLILIGGEISASAYKRLIRSGAAEWTSAKSDLNEVLDIIARRRYVDVTESGLQRGVGHRPVTISFIPSAGGVGNTTLAIEAAAYLKSDRATRHRNICLVDLDFQTSHLCDYLDSEPRLQIAELSSAPERLDEHLFESFRTRHSSGLDLFAAPRSKFAFEDLDIHAVDALLSMIASRYHFIFIDCPVTWLSWTPQIIAASEGVVITGINTIPCLRQVTETLAVVRSSGSAALQIAIAINRCERTLLGSILRRKHVEMALPDERLFLITNRPEAVESVNMGMPMLLGASAGKLRKELAPLASFCSGLRSSRLVSL
jgi:Flp pilus assembly CpaE family ATPase